MSKKILKKYIITLFLIPVMAFPAIAGVDYDAGMNAYNRGDYPFAKILFQKAIKTNYYDVNARYMYCQILSREKKYDEAKKEYETIIKIAPSSQAATLSKQGISNIDAYNRKKLAEQQKANSENNPNKTTNNQSVQAKKPAVPEQKITATDYLKNAYRGGQKYLRPRGITRVYIEPDATFKPLMQQAYSEWQSALGSNVMFSYSGNKADASDVVTFLKHNGAQGMQEGGHCQYNIQGNTLKGNTIVIRAYGPDGKQLPKNVIYHTMLHEIGHSIGIMGHSPYPGDIMTQGVSTFLPHLSERDKNTARLLYKDYGKQPDKESIKEAKTAELNDIARRIPNDPSSLIDLGDEAVAAGEYEDAVKYYQKAEMIKSSPDIYYRMIKAYKALKDNDNVASCYKKILLIDKGNKTALNNLLVLYQQQNRFRDGKTVLDSFIQKNPDLAKDADILKYKNIFSDKNIEAVEARARVFGGGNIK